MLRLKQSNNLDTYHPSQLLLFHFTFFSSFTSCRSCCEVRTQVNESLLEISQIQGSSEHLIPQPASGNISYLLGMKLESSSLLRNIFNRGLLLYLLCGTSSPTRPKLKGPLPPSLSFATTLRSFSLMVAMTIYSLEWLLPSNLKRFPVPS